MKGFPYDAYPEEFFPDASGVYAVRTIGAGTANLNDAWGGVAFRLSAGGTYFTFYPVDNPIWIRLTPAGLAPGTDELNGVRVPANTPYRVWVPARTPVADIYVQSATSVRVWQSSSNESNRPPAPTVFSASTLLSASPTTFTQWDGNQTITVSGTGFTPASVVIVDGISVPTTLVSTTTLTATIPELIFRTSGTKTLSVALASGTLTLDVGAFAPAGLVLELVADDAYVTRDSFNNVSSWTAATGPSLTAGASPVWNPSYNWGAVTRGAIQFTPNAYMYDGPINSLVPMAQHTLAVVFQASSVGTNDADPRLNDSFFSIDSKIFGPALRNNSGAFNITYYNVSSSATHETAQVSLDSTTYAMVGSHNDTQLTLMMNVLTEATGSTGVTDNLGGTILVGASNAGALFFTGYIGYIALYNVQLSLEDRRRLSRKLVVEFGVL